MRVGPVRISLYVKIMFDGLGRSAIAARYFASTLAVAGGGVGAALAGAADQHATATRLSAIQYRAARASLRTNGFLDRARHGGQCRVDTRRILASALCHRR